MSYLCLDIEPDIDSRNYGLSDEGRKDQENPDYQEQEELVLVPHRNSGRIRRVDQISLSHIYSDIERSKDEMFSLSTCLKGQLTLNGTLCRWIWTSMTQFL